ncbi:cytidylate kinase [Desulforamulus reducens MI-1]|uniref:Cytidylate kinase n=1 Tax=Desulforamulus reducens (strain ATCC BAA-1160 / DSM 100696 / MI-1) TaxID=349161 RepID=KCY_DESRM|nr:(d)CMP kinase [Desulforamulus reducens]A4J3N3.1 RecName: Full=Cytidylate kinase; Short=CK; AltName: Full=Cytidine monophosphate kinase; Short=CMP kinase [Desulforamulus reducens MI-1]ABO49686.1 cytidylate kinase [Desulforamulus reducens MI-1]
MTEHKCIAIDGPAGAGKSTVAKKVAQKLNLLYIDTGAMYRAVTLKALRERINLWDDIALIELAKRTIITLLAGQKQSVLLDGLDVTREIRTPEVTNNVSIVAKIAGVREVLVQRQREMAEEAGVVMDGRDIGTVVLPKAKAKFFLTASAEERARRRAKEMMNFGYDVDLEQLIKEIEERDFMDSNRAVSPLVPAEDAVLIDSSGMTIDEVVNSIITWVEKGK